MAERDEMTKKELDKQKLIFVNKDLFSQVPSKMPEI